MNEYNRITQLYQSYNRCVKNAIEANLKGDFHSECFWDDNAREQYRQIEQLEKAQKELRSIRNDREVMERIVAYYEKA